MVRDLNASYTQATSGRRMQAGINRLTLTDDNWCKRVGARKVKAHVNPSTAEEGQPREDALGNEWADGEAKAAAAMHPQPAPAMVTELDAALRRAKVVVRTIAKVTQVFPALPKDRMERPPRRIEGACFQSSGGHAWSFSNGLWRCTCCLEITLSRHITPLLAAQTCSGAKPSLQVEAMAARGHVMARTVAEVPILFCLKCGAFTARRAYGLAAACRGRPTAPGAKALARIRRGVQPWQSGGSRHRGTTHSFTEAWSTEANSYGMQGPTDRPAKRRLATAQSVQPCPAAANEDAMDFPPSPSPFQQAQQQQQRRGGAGVNGCTMPAAKQPRHDADDAFLEPPAVFDPARVYPRPRRR